MHKNIQPIILSYNQPEYTEKLYAKLKTDGFQDIILIDNGSKSDLISNLSNFRLPRNIKMGGALQVVLSYLLNYYPSNWYLFITTSVYLLDEINYYNHINKCILKTSRYPVGAIMPSIAIPTPVKTLELHSSINAYSICWNIDQIFYVVKHDIAKLCEKNRNAWFNKELQYGAGINQELSHQCYQSNHIVIKMNKTPVKWIPGNGYNNETRDNIPHDEYRITMRLNRTESFRNKYGDWVKTFKKTYTEALENIRTMYDINDFIVLPSDFNP